MSSLAMADMQESSHIGETSPESFNAEAFVPSQYLNQYFTRVEQDESRLIDWQSTVLAERISQHLAERDLQRFGLHIDAGCGPTVHHMIAMSPYSESILVMDYLEDNIAEVQKWLSGVNDAHDWRHFTRAILHAEGIEQPDEAMIFAREDDARNKIVVANPIIDGTRGVGLFEPFDLKQPLPWMKELSGKGELVSSFYVADSCTDDIEEFNTMTKNTFELVAPGGLFIGCYLGGCESYAVGDQFIKSVNLSEDDLSLALKLASAEDIVIVRYETPENSPEGFNHIFAVSAIKPL